MQQRAHLDSFETEIKDAQSPNLLIFHCASPWPTWRNMCYLSGQTLDCNPIDHPDCERCAIKEEKSYLGSWLPRKLSPSPAWDSLSGLYCLECDCSLPFLFTPSLLRCHNGSRPGLDGGEMGVIKSDPQGAMCRCHMYSDAISLRYCRRMLLHWRNAAGDTYNYMTSRTLKGWHPQTAAMSIRRCVWEYVCSYSGCSIKREHACVKKKK